jgi:hypothetical protein
MTTANVQIKKILVGRGNATISSNYAGVRGEVTMNTTTKALHVHDGVTTGGWPLATEFYVANLIASAGGVPGPQGPQGNIGAQGPQGIQGNVGPQGTQGNVGPQGIQGNTGAQGSQGIQGNVGATGATGPQGIQGNVGATGSQGPQGIQGNTGATGAQGIQGNVGATGSQGPQGSPGIQGNVGAQGVQGNAGATGSQGIQGNIGPQGPQGIQGQQGNTGAQGVSVTLVGNVATSGNLPLTGNAGEAYIVTTTGNLFFWNSNISVWADIGPIVGPQGDAGPQGIQGNTGAQGSQGIQGNIGPQGPQGIQGNIGPQGPQGEQGIQGNVGAQGPQGIQGNVGATGSQGPQGIQGNTGAQGSQGIQGNVGATGSQGPQGIQGNTGAQGSQGIQGNIGPQGIQGNVGAQGIQGNIGPQGPVGPAGSAANTGDFTFTHSNLASSTNANIRITTNGNAFVLGSNGNLTLPNNMSFVSSPAMSTTGIVFGDGSYQNTAYTGAPVSQLVNGVHTVILDSTGNVTVPASILPTVDNTQDLGSATNRFRHLYVGPGTVYIGNAAIKSTLTGNLILPGVTRAVANTAYAEEVYEEDDQEYSFATVPTVIDNARYSDLSGRVNGLSFTPAEYSVIQLDGDGYIDGITITSPGSGYSDQVDSLADQDMWATEVATPFTDFNANDWVQIPFRVNSRAGESEYDFNTGGGSGDTLTNGDWAASLNDTGSLSVDNTDDEQNYFTLTPVGNEDASYGLQIGIDNQAAWFFSNAGSITFPDDTVQTTAYTGGNGGGSGDRLTNGEYSLILDSAGKLSFPGNLAIDNGVISNLNSIDEGALVVGSQIEVALERTTINNQVTNSLGEGGPLLQTQSLIEVMAGNVTIGSQVINGAGNGPGSTLAVASLLQTNASNVIIGHATFNGLEESTLQTVNLVEINSNNVLIGQRVTNSLNGNVTLDAFAGWEFSTDGNLTLPAGGDILNSNGQSVLGNITVTPVTVGNVASGAEGALWYNTDDGRTYVYALDTWIDASPAVVPGNMVGYGQDGNITLRDDTSINYANGVSILSGIDSSYGDAEVAEFLGAFTGNIAKVSSSPLKISSANLTLFSDNETWRMVFPDGTVQTTAYTGGAGGAGNALVNGGYTVALQANGVVTIGADATISNDGEFRLWATDTDITVYRNGQDGYGVTAGTIETFTDNVLRTVTNSNGFELKTGNIIIPNDKGVVFANGVNILSTVGAGAYGNTQVASYLLQFDGDIEFTSSTARIGNVDVITVMDSVQSPVYRFVNGSKITGIGNNLNIRTTSGVPGGPVTKISDNQGWDGGSVGTDLPTTGGTGTGLTVDVVDSGSAYAGISINTPGTGYTNGDVLTVTNGGMSDTFSISVPVYDWQLGNTGSTTFPSNLTIQSNPFNPGTVISQANALISIATTGNAATYIGWSEFEYEPGNIALVAFNETAGGLVAIQTGATTGPEAFNEWIFDADGTLTFPTGGNLIFDSSATSVIDGVTSITANGNVTAAQYNFANGVNIFDTITGVTSINSSVSTLTVSDASGDYTYGALNYDYAVNGASNSFDIQYSAPLAFGNVDINVGNVTATGTANVANLIISGTAPGTLTGSAGDTAGMIRVDSNYIYYCTSTFVPASYTVGWEGAISNNLYITKGAYPTPQVGWTVTQNIYTFTIDSVTDNGSNWALVYTGIPYGSPQGGTATLTNPVQPNIWTQTPLAATVYANTNVAAYLTTANISTTGNITAGNVSATRYNFANGVNILSTVGAGSYGNTQVASYLLNFDGDIEFTSSTAKIGNVDVITVMDSIRSPAYQFSNSVSILSNVVSKTTGSWTVTTGTNTYSIQLAENGTYQIWVDCNIPNGILAYNATATVTNGNVPVVGVQYAWVYNGGGTPIDFVSIPNQFVGTANTIVRSSVSPSATTNRLDFGINNTSGGNVTVRYGYVKIS